MQNVNKNKKRRTMMTTVTAPKGTWHQALFSGHYLNPFNPQPLYKAGAVVIILQVRNRSHRKE